MINQNFYLDFLIDLKTDHVEFDSSSATKILGDNISRFASGTDILLRFTNTEDRVQLLDAIGNCIDNGTPICQFYRWEISKGIFKALEVRAEFVVPHQLVGVIIDQEVNTSRLFPMLTPQQLAKLKSETYFLINRKGEIIQQVNSEQCSDIPNNLPDQARKFLIGHPIEKNAEGFCFFKVPSNSIDESEELALCVCNSTRPGELINELESLLNRFRNF